jgi:transposase-like protein
MKELDQEVQRIAKLPSWSEAEAQRVVDAWRESGESRAVFGRQYGIHVHHLYYWVAAAEKRGRKLAVGERVKFPPVEVVPEKKADSAVPIEIRSIRIPRGFDPAELRAAIQSLG